MPLSFTVCLRQKFARRIDFTGRVFSPSSCLTIYGYYFFFFWACWIMRRRAQAGAGVKTINYMDVVPPQSAQHPHRHTCCIRRSEGSTWNAQRFCFGLGFWVFLYPLPPMIGVSCIASVVAGACTPKDFLVGGEGVGRVASPMRC
ncbi:hypothetical protein M433DRAFT_235307 [Acidomyces richmondensis BFW]|nr:hypothetical protein M433DRAFT_235307 [Acidomyces richmondensis BFW]